jgi:hypothetical protein
VRYLKSGRAEKTFDHPGTKWAATAVQGSRLLTLGDDNAIRIWDLPRGTRLGQLAVFQGGEWVLSVPAGFFAAKEAAAETRQVGRTFTLSPGANVIELIAFNGDGTIASAPEKLELVLEDSISRQLRCTCSRLRPTNTAISHCS